MSGPERELLIGLVSISDRASAGTYKDEGIPSLREWFGRALASPWRDRKSTRLNSSHTDISRMPSSA